MARITGIGEWLEAVGKLSTNKLKVEALRMNNSLELRIILQGAYDDSVEWSLPSGIPPYVPSKLPDQEGVLLHEMRRNNGNSIRYFIKGFYDHLSATKKEMMFVELLEKVAPKDAELLCTIKDKKAIKGISLAVVKEAFPDLIQGKVKEEPNLEIAGLESIDG